MELLNWDAISTGIELIGLIALLGTLIYLAIEIRQNTASVNTARYETITTGFNDIDSAIVSDPDLAFLFNAGMTTPESLDEREQARVAFIFRMFYNQYNKIFHLYRTNVLAEEEWVIYAKQAGWFLGSRGGLKFLEHNRDYPEFIKAIEPFMGERGLLEFSFTNHDTTSEAVNGDT